MNNLTLNQQDVPLPSAPMPTLPVEQYLKRAAIAMTPIIITTIGRWLIGRGYISQETLDSWTSGHSQEVTNLLLFTATSGLIYLREHQADGAIQAALRMHARLKGGQLAEPQHARRARLARRVSEDEDEDVAIVPLNRVARRQQRKQSETEE